MVERADKFENGYVVVRGWWFNVYDILVPVSFRIFVALRSPPAQFRPHFVPTTQHTTLLGPGCAEHDL